MEQFKRIILASKSPRRKEFLEKLGVQFDVIASEIDESLIKGSSPSQLVMNLSKAKARAVEKNLTADSVIVSADTIVVYKGERLGKPKDYDDAVNMLLKLNGKTHCVYTGVTLLSKDYISTFYDRSRVKFKNMTCEQIKKYVTEKKPLDKAGAYGIQDGDVVESYTGSLSNIIGLPMEKLEALLVEKGVINGKY